MTCYFLQGALRLPPQPWTPASRCARALAAAIDRPAEALTGVLLNNYPAGSGSIPTMTRCARTAPKSIATLSGVRAAPVLRRHGDRAMAGTTEVLLTPRSVVMMAGATQDHYEHELPLRDGDEPRDLPRSARSCRASRTRSRSANDLCVEEAKPR